MGRPFPGVKCVFAQMLFYSRNLRSTNRTQCWSVPKVILKFTFGLVETHSDDFSPIVNPWVAPPAGQMWFSHIRFCYRNFRPTNRTQCWRVPKVVLKCTLGLAETQSYDFGPPANPWVAPPPGQIFFFAHI